MTDLRVIIGAGDQRWPGWIPTQRQDLDLLDPDSFAAWFGDRLADSMLCEHVWEHLTFAEGLEAARLCLRYLRPCGRLRVAVPDGNFPDEQYQRTVQIGGPGPVDHPAADHKIVHTATTITDMFTQAGFVTDLLEWCDTRGTFHVNPWSLDDGPIYRSSLIDHRNINYRNDTGPPGFVSLIIDAFAPHPT